MPSLPFMNFGSKRDIQRFAQHVFGISDDDPMVVQVWTVFECLENPDHSWEVFFRRSRMPYADFARIAGERMSESEASEWVGRKMIGALKGRNACYRGHAGDKFPDLFKPEHTAKH